MIENKLTRKHENDPVQGNERINDPNSKAEGLATILTNLVVSIAFFSFYDSLFSLTRLSKLKEAEKYKISFC